MWDYYKVELFFINRVMGGVPKNKKIIEDWLNARRMKDAKFEKQKEAGVGHKSLEEIAKEVGGTAEDLILSKEESTWVGFLHDDVGIFAREHQIKGHLKDCANQIKKLKGQAVTALRDKIANKVYLVDEKNYFMKTNSHIMEKDSHIIKEPDGSFEHGIRVDTPQGKRSALKKNDYIDGAHLSFTLKVFKDGMITIDILRRVLEYGSVHGIFSERAHGYGKYKGKISVAEELMEQNNIH